ncbi:hypothetical protein PG997_001413 [Apiospora hydei]|uniref:Uncharacterized protein n=1 Tax=Apiospora hydei TaxID=1337664 RepID=A0ABR1XDQ1_9PEZI
MRKRKLDDTRLASDWPEMAQRRAVMTEPTSRPSILGQSAWPVELTSFPAFQASSIPVPYRKIGRRHVSGESRYPSEVCSSGAWMSCASDDDLVVGLFPVIAKSTGLQATTTPVFCVKKPRLRFVIFSFPISPAYATLNIALG